MNKKARGARGRGGHGNAGTRKSNGRNMGGLPNVRDVPAAEQPDIILKKIQLCSKRYTFDEIVSIETERGKMLKTSTLIELREVRAQK